MGSNRSKRIPDPLEAAVAEVLFVDGGEFGDALLDEEERGPPIVGAAAGVASYCSRFGRRFRRLPTVRAARCIHLISPASSGPD